jgi:hypothetical protein
MKKTAGWRKSFPAIFFELLKKVPNRYQTQLFSGAPLP